MNINRREDVCIASSLFLRCPGLRAVVLDVPTMEGYTFRAGGLTLIGTRGYNFVQVCAYALLDGMR